LKKTRGDYKKTKTWRLVLGGIGEILIKGELRKKEK